MEYIIGLVLVVGLVVLIYFCLTTLLLYLFNLFTGILPLIGLVIIMVALVIGLVIAIRALVRAMKATYGKEK